MDKLLFIYNAKSGKTNAALDSLHKLISPGNYSCSLCNITHGVFKERTAWKNFRKETNLTMEFLHIDEFQEQYASKFGYKFTFPIVLSANTNGLEIFITSEELSSIKDPEKLIETIISRRRIFSI